MLKIFFGLFYLQCLIQLRKLNEWLYPLAFFILLIVLYPLLFTPEVMVLQRYCASFIWLAVLFAIFLASTSLFNAESEDQAIEQFLFASIPFSLFIAAKLSAQYCLTVIPILIITPILAASFHLQFNAQLPLLFSLLLGTPIILLLNCFGVALTYGLRQQGVLLGLIIFPLLVPVLIFAVNIVNAAQASLPYQGPMLFLAGLMVLAGVILPYLIAVTLKLSLEA